MGLLILLRLQGPSRVGVDCLEDGELISYCSFDDLIYMDLLGVWLGWMRTHFKYMIPLVFLHREYLYHSSHHRLNSSLLGMPFGCLARKTQQYVHFLGVLGCRARVLSSLT